MKLENLWLHAFNLAVKNGNSTNAVKIANDAVSGWRNSGLSFEHEKWAQFDKPATTDVKAADTSGALYTIAQQELIKLKQGAPETLQSEIEAANTGGVAETCNGNCGMNYCDDNGCVERKRHLVGEPIQAEPEESFYWKPVSEFTKEDAFFDIANFLVTIRANGDVDAFAEVDDMNIRNATKYLARKARKAVAGSWVWDGMKSPVETVWVQEGLSVFFFFANGSCSTFYPTLEAAQLEAERYYKLYVAPNQNKA